MVRKQLVILAAMCVMVSQGFAAGAGTSGAQFLKILAAPGPAAMAGVYTAFSGDVNSMAVNPAGMASMSKKELAVVQNSWIQDISNQYLAFGMPVEKVGVFGLGVTMVSITDMIKRDNTGADTGTFDASDMAIGLSYAKGLSTKLDLGLNLKSISCTIDDEKATAMAADIGFLYKVSKKVDMGLVAQNVGTEIKFIEEGDPLPMTIKLGWLYKPMEALKAGIDVSMPNDADVYAGIGGEYTITAGDKLMFPIRLGYRSGVDTEDLSGLSVGAGICYNKVAAIDFAWVPMGILGDTIKFGVAFKF